MEVQLPAFFIYCTLMLLGIMLEHGQGINALHVAGNETDRLALLAFKDQITADPHQVLTSWNNSAHFCSWHGINCSRRHGRVTKLYLPDLGLKGLLSPHLGNLSFLRVLYIARNGFHGSIPTELARLFRLNALIMANNSLQGEIPASLSNCSRLLVLNLGGNGLEGSIPIQLSSLPQLSSLHLYENKLTGTISPSLGNLSKLEVMSLLENSIGGRIPSELGRLFSLRFLSCGGNKLSDRLPESLYNLSSLTVFDVTLNQLWGRLPSNMGLTMSNLNGLYLAGNNFTGPLPSTLANASHLKVLEVSDNSFIGPVPFDLGKLQNLSLFSIWGNRLGGVGNNDLHFITSLSNCSRLFRLDAGNNALVGSLPKSMVNLSKHLSYLALVENRIHGMIPSGIGNLEQLQSLDLDENLLKGEIPPAIGKFPRLAHLSLSMNKLSGMIPANIGNLTQLYRVYVDGNHLQGSIPSTTWHCKGLVVLDLSNNKLSGKLPIPVFNLSSLVEVALDNNLLTGPLPPQVGNLIYVTRFSVSSNRFSGKIPPTIGSCSMLQYLYMQNNYFNGTIPPSLAYVKGIKHINFSYNNLSGNIPQILSKLNEINYLDFSFNSLEGEVPKVGVFSNISAIIVEGNPKLCGGIPELHLTPCPQQATSRVRKSLSRKVIIPIVGSIVVAMIICCLALIYARKNHRKDHSSTSSSINPLARVSYPELFRATNGFSSSNLIGHGSFGTVYKGVLEHYQAVVAIKVLNLDQVHALKTFMAECEALRNIRHRNLVKILTSCSSLDSKGNDFKALVFELMSNGSVEQWLHQQMNSNDSRKYLSFSKRLDVAIDVANALDYLHNQCETPIVHCDLKPSNILLDDDMVAHLGDFGLAKSLLTSRDHSSSHQPSTSILKGSIGYIAPEYGTRSTVTTHGDVYSYGIVLLEMITGKKPTNKIFYDGLNLPKYVKMAIPEGLTEVLDPQLLQREDPRERGKLIECLLSIAKIGVTCSAEHPKERMDVRDICSELIKVKDKSFTS